MPVRSGDLGTSGVLEGVRGTQTRCADLGEVHDGDRELHGGQGSPRNTKREEDDWGENLWALGFYTPIVKLRKCPRQGTGITRGGTRFLPRDGNYSFL